MKISQPECEKFAARLIEAMLDAGQHSLRNSKTGVSTLQLRKAAGVTNEMARRYTLGQAWPDNEKMARIADWLSVRRAWLQYDEGPKTFVKNQQVSEDPSLYPAQNLQLNHKQITLLQDCMSYAINCRSTYQLDFNERAAAKVAASFFNHCLRYNRTPQSIPEEVILAALNATTGTENN